MKHRSSRTTRGRILHRLLAALVLPVPRAAHAAPAEPFPDEAVEIYAARATELFQQAETLRAQHDRGAARHYYAAARAAAAALERVDRAAPHYLVYAQTLASRVVRAYKHALILLDHPLLWSTARTWCASPAVVTLDPAAHPRLTEVRAWCDALPPPPPQLAGKPVYDPWTGMPVPPSPPPPPALARQRLLSGPPANTTARVADPTEHPFLSTARDDRADVFLTTARKQ